MLLSSAEWELTTGGASALPADAWVLLGGEPGETVRIPVGESEAEPLFNVPNVVSLLGCAATVAWLAGGSVWWIVLGLGLDELDGVIARSLGQTSRFGGQLDWAIDVSTAGAIAMKLGGVWPWLLPPIIAFQAWLRQQDVAPAFGSARAAMVLLGLNGVGV